MPLTNFPQGLSSFGFPILGYPLPTTGQAYFVNTATGGDAPGYGTDPLRPFKTIAYAVTRVADGKGDVIFVMPGHTESITGAAGWSIAKAGVSIIGLGNGVQRPLITFSTATAAQIIVAAAGDNVTLRNLQFDLTGIDAVAVAFSILGTDFIAQDCRFIISTASAQAVKAFTISAARPSFINCNFEGTSDAGPTSAIETAVAVDGLKVVNCRIAGNFSAAPINAPGALHLTNMVLEGNILIQYNGTAKAVIVLTTSSTGVGRNNSFCGHTWATAADAITNGGNAAMWWFENYGFDDAGGEVSGVLVPAAGTIS